MRRFCQIVVGLGVVAMACSTPTVCACPPALSAIVVRGELITAAGQPVSGATLMFDAIPQRTPPLTPHFEGGLATTSASGSFQAIVSSVWSPGPQELHVGVVLTASTDTVKLFAGVPEFRHSGDRPDTLNVQLRLP